MPRELVAFRKTVWRYYRDQGRHDLPWRHTYDPYRIFISEVMLQQTQVPRVLKKYPEFLKAFPNWKSLARAPIPKLLRVWQGMGYNRRALQLKRAAEIVVKEYGGKLPQDPELLDELPGIGKATAASIAAFAFNLPTVFIETNIRRVFIHHLFPTEEHSYILKNVRITDDEILKLVEATLDRRNPREWYWALMDYGSMLGKTVPNPNRRSAHYRTQSSFKGSQREARAKAIRHLSHVKSAPLTALSKAMGRTKSEASAILSTLISEGFIENKGSSFIIRKS